MKGAPVIVLAALAGWWFDLDAGATFALAGAVGVLWAWWEIDDRLRSIQDRLGDRMD